MHPSFSAIYILNMVYYIAEKSGNMKTLELDKVITKTVVSRYWLYFLESIRTKEK